MRITLISNIYRSKKEGGKVFGVLEKGQKDGVI